MQTLLNKLIQLIKNDDWISKYTVFLVTSIGEILKLFAQQRTPCKHIIYIYAYVCVLFRYVGRCYPGWILHDNKCYRFMGGVAPYDVAEKQCKVR